MKSSLRVMNSDSLPDLSVVIDAFWAGPDDFLALRANLETVVKDLKSTGAAFEVLVMASRTAELSIEGLSIVNCKGAGGYERKSLGFARARAALVVFLDGDCRPDPEFFHRLRRRFKEEPGLRALTGSLRYEGESYLSRLNSVLSFGPLFETQSSLDENFICNTNNFALRQDGVPEPLFGSWKGRVNGDSYISRWFYEQGTPIVVDPELKIRHADLSFSVMALLERHFREYLRRLRSPEELSPRRASSWRMLRSMMFSFRDRTHRFARYSKHIEFSNIERWGAPFVFVLYALLDAVALACLMSVPYLAKRWFSYQEGRSF